MENKRKTFEEFLKDRHAAFYIGTDDNMPDAFDTWLEEVGIDFIIDAADSFGRIEYLEGKAAGLQMAEDMFAKLTTSHDH